MPLVNDAVSPAPSPEPGRPLTSTLTCVGRQCAANESEFCVSGASPASLFVPSVNTLYTPSDGAFCSSDNDGDEH